MVLLVILLAALMGVVALVSPATVLELTGNEGGTATARNEARAVYGGTGLAVAALLAASPWMHGGETVRWTIGALFFAMGSSRAIGLVLDFPRTALPIVYLVLELISAAILL